MHAVYMIPPVEGKATITCLSTNSLLMRTPLRATERLVAGYRLSLTLPFRHATQACGGRGSAVVRRGSHNEDCRRELPGAATARSANLADNHPTDRPRESCRAKES